jgi:xanthine dehydrogenase accessory factor
VYIVCIVAGRAMILAELVQAIADRQPVVLATVVDTRRSVPRRPGSKMLIYPGGAISGTIGGGEMEARVIAEALVALTIGRPRRLTYTLTDPTSGDPGVCGGEVELYLEPHMPTTTIFVVGAGHVGRAVIELATWLGYRVVAWDDRADVAGAVSGAEAVLTGSFSDAMVESPIDEHTSVVMVTRNVALDLEIIPALLATPAAYIGLMGSARRWDTTRDKLLAMGVAAGDLHRVRAPIGVEIHAETPAEIAVSILAEVIGHHRLESPT